MKKTAITILIIAVALVGYAAGSSHNIQHIAGATAGQVHVADPWGYSQYQVHTWHDSKPAQYGNDAIVAPTWDRLTNAQAQVYKQLGMIDAKGNPATGKIRKQPLPPSKTAPVPNSRGTVTVRPAHPHPAISPNASQAEVDAMNTDMAHMKAEMHHIERQVGKALDLSVASMAVAELPQATDGRSSLNIGAASADGVTGEAIGYSKNFGKSHEYVVKISFAHAGSENSAGIGFGWQF